MGLQEVKNWLLCSKWAKWLFILSGAGGGYFAGGKLNYRGGKRVVATLAGGGAGWLASYLLGRSCGVVGMGDDMLPETEPHLLGPALAQYTPQASSAAIREERRTVTPTTQTLMSSSARTPAAPTIMSSSPRTPTPASFMPTPTRTAAGPTLTTTNEALLNSASMVTPTIPGTMAGVGKRPRKTRSLLGGTGGGAYGS